MSEQFDLSREEGWHYGSREEKMADASLIRFVFRGLEISYQHEKEKRTESLIKLREWFPEAIFLSEDSQTEV